MAEPEMQQLQVPEGTYSGSTAAKNWVECRLKNVVLVNPYLSLSRVKWGESACFLPMEAVGADGQVDYSEPRNSKDLVSGFTNFEAGDVILAKITPCFENGKGAVLSDMPTRIGFGSTEFHVLRAKQKAIPKFIYYITKSDLFMKQGEALMIGSAGQKRVATSYVESFHLALPTLNEQRAIVGFLEEKTSLVARAVSAKERQIERLKERKQILIQQAVTRGLEPEAPIRDSGIEWIGEIPTHWKIMANRALFRERVEPGREDLPLLSVSIHSGVSEEEISEEENIRGRVKIEDKTKYIRVRPGDIAFNMMRAWQGAIGAVRVEGMVSPAYTIAVPRPSLDARYFEYQYRTPGFIQQMDRYSKGITDFRKRLYWDGFKQLITLVPPIEEQRAIVGFIEQAMLKQNAAMALLEQQITKLKEYKATLINSAVTGKIKVPGVVEPAEIKEREIA
ncbi:MAG: restriction endonuclease subunit S [Telluria sp.]|nr:restriction endonuclease subunit S [Telluria sp.]